MPGAPFGKHRAPIPHRLLLCSETNLLTWLVVYLCQHVLNGILIPQGFWVRRSVTTGATPVHNLLGLERINAVKFWVLLY